MLLRSISCKSFLSFGEPMEMEVGSGPTATAPRAARARGAAEVGAGPEQLAQHGQRWARTSPGPV